MDQEQVDSQNSRSSEALTLDEKTAEVVSKMALAHEIVMNESFKLEELPQNS